MRLKLAAPATESRRQKSRFRRTIARGAGQTEPSLIGEGATRRCDQSGLRTDIFPARLSARAAGEGFPTAASNTKGDRTLNRVSKRLIVTKPGEYRRLEEKLPAPRCGSNRELDEKHTSEVCSPRATKQLSAFAQFIGDGQDAATEQHHRSRLGSVIDGQVVDDEMRTTSIVAVVDAARGNEVHFIHPSPV